MVEFVSYNSKFPNLCSGTLVIKVNGEEISLENYLISGGQCWNDRKIDIPNATIIEECNVLRKEIKELKSMVKELLDK